MEFRPTQAEDALTLQKETYYTPESIESKAREFLVALQNARQRDGIRLSPDQSALLVLDMQEYFLSTSSHAFVPSAPAILPGIRALVNAYHTRQGVIIFTRHLNTLQNAGQMAHWWRDLIRVDSPLSKISSELDTSTGFVIEKSQYDAFHNTSLETLLHDHGVTQVVVCGVMTHLCCETTARAAFMRGYEVFFPIDGTATYNQAFHQASLLNLAHGFATPVLVHELLQVFDEHPA